MGRCVKPTKWGRCRKCKECLQSRLRSWQFRMLLEAMLYDADQTTFLTLTYKNECLPPDEDTAKRSFQKWLKRLRKVVNSEFDVRYVAALEKGTQGTQRYHWHCILYGVRFTSFNRQLLSDSWRNGFLDWKPATPGRMAYVLKYVIKGGKFLMSRRPGLGAGMIEYLNKTIDSLKPAEIEKLNYNHDSVNYLIRRKWGLQENEIQVNCFQIGGYHFPLHAYIKKLIRRKVKHGKKE